MLKNTKTLVQRALVLTALLAATALPSALGQESTSVVDDVSLDLGADIYSHYVWRGMLLTDDPVIQPSVTVGFAGLSLNVWGSIDTTDINESNTTAGPDWRLQELDYTLSYGLPVGDLVSLELGYIEYTFPGTAFERTSEVYAGIGADCLLEPSLKVYYDFDEAKAFYATLGIGHTFELTDALGLSLGAGIGWGDQEYHEFYYGPDTKGFSDYNVSAKLDYAINDNFGIALTVAYSDFIESNIEDAAEMSYGDAGNFYGGVSFSYSF